MTKPCSATIKSPGRGEIVDVGQGRPMSPPSPENYWKRNLDLVPFNPGPSEVCGTHQDRLVRKLRRQKILTYEERKRASEE
jgi:hypothetical protein